MKDWATGEEVNYQCDALNRLLTSNGAKYGYDPNNKRVWKKRPDGTEEFSFYLGNQRLGTYTSSGSYPWSFTAVSTNVYFGGKLIAINSGAVLTDRLGSNVTDGKRYFPWGQEYSSTSGNTEKFTGYFRDSESGLDYADQRYHAPGTGRFITTDPKASSARARDPGSFNRYVYAGGDPVNNTDPTGEDYCWADNVCATPEFCDFAPNWSGTSQDRWLEELAPKYLYYGGPGATPEMILSAMKACAGGGDFADDSLTVGGMYVYQLLVDVRVEYPEAGCFAFPQWAEVGGDAFGKVFTIGNTLGGVIGGSFGWLWSHTGGDGAATVQFGHNAIEFLNNPATASDTAFTSGNAIVYSGQPGDPAGAYGNTTTFGEHEEAHTHQYQWSGPFFLTLWAFDGWINGGELNPANSGNQFELGAC